MFDKPSSEGEQLLFERMTSAAEVAGATEVSWYRHILTLSAGALALLAGFPPEEQVPKLSLTFLISAWVLLGLGIILGAIATYTEVYRRNYLARRLWLLWQDHIHEHSIPEELLEEKTVPLYLRLSKVWMLVVLSIALICFVAYAITRVIF